MRNINLHNLTKKMQNIALGLILCLLFVSPFFSSPALAYWNTVKCEQEEVDEKKFEKKGFSKEQIEKIKATNKAKYEFCLAKKQIADKEAEKTDAGRMTFIYEAEFDPKHFGRVNEDGTIEGGNTGDKIQSMGGMGAAPITAGKLLEMTKKSYPNMYQNLVNKAQAYNALMEGGACGKYPHGCPVGMKCMSKYSSQSVDPQANVGTFSDTEFDCKDATDWYARWNDASNIPPEKRNNSVTVNIAGNTTTLTTDSKGNTTAEEHLVTENIPDTPKIIEIKKQEGSNESCHIDRMRQKYQASCYSCIIVKTLITTFLDACSNAEDITTEAAIIILQIGLMLWMAFFVIQKISSFTNIEPAAMVNELFITLFKCLVAYVVIVSGVATFMTYIVEPIMNAGASYGIALLEASPSHLELVPNSTYAVKGTKVVSPQLINDIMGFTQSMDKTVANNLMIGHSLTCHSINAGAWRWTLNLVGSEIFTIVIPNFWIWICGAAIWFCGFMLTLGFSYYLLDISFKMGFAVIVFPVLMALWPFKPTEGKIKSCISTILKAAGTFMMLGMTGSYALILVSKSIRDLDEFYDRIAAGDSEWISETFAITGPYFIIIVFAYLYSMKLIGSTISDYVNRFFEGGLINQTPMHAEAKRMTEIAKKATIGVGKKAIKTTAKVGGKVTEKVAKKAFAAAKFVRNKFKGKDDEKAKNAISATGSATKHSGAAVKQTGQAVKQTGQAVEGAGGAVEGAGGAVEGAGKGVAAGGDALMGKGAALSATGLGAIVGVPMLIAGAAMKAGGTAVQYTGTATKAVGKGMKAVGKSMKSAGKVIEKAGAAVEKAGAKLEKKGQSWKKKGSQMGKKDNTQSNDNAPNGNAPDSDQQNNNTDGQDNQ